MNFFAHCNLSRREEGLPQFIFAAGGHARFPKCVVAGFVQVKHPTGKACLAKPVMLKK